MKNATEKRTRILKIQGDIKVLDVYPKVEVPKILLNGLWLDKAGFKAYGKVQVDVKPGELVLKPLK